MEKQLTEQSLEKRLRQMFTSKQQASSFQKQVDMKSQPGQNVLGAYIFFSYIIAALVFTGIILRDLVILNSQDGIKKNGNKANDSVAKGHHKKRKAQLFMALSGMSFAALTYSMLSFLIVSYQNWTVIGGIPLPQTVFGENGLGARPLHLWSWSTSSTLFQDFAISICAKPRHFWWTQQVLLYSFGWNIFMSISGRTRMIPHLWAYFILDQILPVSFTQNLFYTALLLAPTGLSRQIRQKNTLQSLTVVAYILGLAAAPTLVHTSWVVPIIFFLRLLLFAPYLLFQPNNQIISSTALYSSRNVLSKHRATFLPLVAASIFFHVQSMGLFTTAIRSLWDNFAVSTLGLDYIVAVLSALLFQVANLEGG